MTKYWLGIVSKDHVAIGKQYGIAQLSHGTRGPLERLHQGDWLIYYSSKTSMDDGVPLQMFTAIGSIVDDELFEYPMENGRTPWRRAMQYLDCKDAPIRPLLDSLSFTMGKKNWGYAFRFGLLEITGEDFYLIAQAMGAKI